VAKNRVSSNAPGGLIKLSSGNFEKALVLSKVGIAIPEAPETMN